MWQEIRQLYVTKSSIDLGMQFGRGKASVYFHNLLGSIQLMNYNDVTSQFSYDYAINLPLCDIHQFLSHSQGIKFSSVFNEYRDSAARNDSGRGQLCGKFPCFCCQRKSKGQFHIQVVYSVVGHTQGHGLCIFHPIHFHSSLGNRKKGNNPFTVHHFIMKRKTNC